MNACPVCLGAHLAPAEIVAASGGLRVNCPACGRFGLADEAWDDYLDPSTAAGSCLTPVQRARLSHRLRGGSLKGGRPNIDADFVKRFIDAGCPGPNPAEQATNILRLVGDTVSTTGEHVESLPDEFYAIVGSPNPDFAGELMIELRDRGLLSGIERRVIGASPSLLDASLTLGGWQEYERVKHGHATSRRGFIAMQFGDAVLDPFASEVIKPTVRKGIGYDLVDMRDVARAGVIDNLLREQIRDSAFLLVDLTHDNAGAYWEAGYAEGLGKPVIYLCERSKFNAARTHFDTNHSTTVIWSVDSPNDFARELIATLRRSLELFASNRPVQIGMGGANFMPALKHGR